MRLPRPGTIVVTMLIALGAIWVANNVDAIKKIVGPK